MKITKRQKEQYWENRAKEFFAQKMESDFIYQGNLNRSWFYRLKRFLSDLFN